MLDGSALAQREAIFGRREDADVGAVEEALAVEAPAGGVGGDRHGSGVAAVYAKRRAEGVGFEGGVGEEIRGGNRVEGQPEPRQGRAGRVLGDLEGDEIRSAAGGEE
jgi:hypothetical protein